MLSPLPFDKTFIPCHDEISNNSDIDEWSRNGGIMKKAGFKERFTYWFDTKMSKGTVSMIKMLTVATLVVILLFARIISAGGFAEDDSFFSVFWNNLATSVSTTGIM